MKAEEAERMNKTTEAEKAYVLFTNNLHVLNVF